MKVGTVFFLNLVKMWEVHLSNSVIACDSAANLTAQNLSLWTCAFFSKMAESDSKMAASPLHREESPAEDHLHRSSNLPLAAHKGTCWKLTTAENLQKFQILQRPMTRTTFPPTFSELLLVAYASAVHKNAKQGSHAWKKNRRVNLMQEWASLHQHHQWCLNLAFLLILQLHHTSSPSPWYDQAMRSSAAFTMIACAPTSLAVFFLILLWFEMPTLGQQLEPWCLLMALEDGPRCHSW